MGIKSNIENVRSRIEQAALKSGRKASDGTLVGVSKRISNDLIIEGINSGLKNLGENYAQEFRDKYEFLDREDSKLNWHFIGHLQKNKIKYVIGKMGLFHSLDSTGLAEEIDKRAGQLDINVDMLIEINCAGEGSKTGIPFEEALALLEHAGKLKNITIRGFMTMAPYSEDPEDARPYFRKLREFRDTVLTDYPEANELSMGMSGDFEVAVEEGATIVRVGTSIFGERAERK